MNALIVRIGQTPRVRHPNASQTTMTFLQEAAQLALRDAGLTEKDIDGLVVASFSLGPDHTIDLAWRFGLSVRRLLEDINGGVSATNMLSHAIRGVESGAASNVLIVAGEANRPEDFAKRAANYNSSVRDHLAPLNGNPNSIFAMLTQRQMRKLGLSASDCGHLVLAQRNGPRAILWLRTELRSPWRNIYSLRWLRFRFVDLTVCQLWEGHRPSL